MQNACNAAGRRTFHVKGWKFGRETYERHSGPPNVLPKHFHDTYQIAITTRSPADTSAMAEDWTRLLAVSLCSIPAKCIAQQAHASVALEMRPCSFTWMSLG